MQGLGFILIVACLLGDMATPLCPGAFRFDPAQSIQAIGSRALTPLSPDLRPPTPPQREVIHTPVRLITQGVATTAIAAHVRRPVHWRRTLASRQTDFGFPRRSEDG